MSNYPLCFYRALEQHVPGLGCNKLRILLEHFNFSCLTFLQHLRDGCNRCWKHSVLVIFKCPLMFQQSLSALGRIIYIACKTKCVKCSLVRENKIPEWKETGWKMQRKSRRPNRLGAEGDRYSEGIIISSVLKPPSAPFRVKSLPPPLK